MYLRVFTLQARYNTANTINLVIMFSYAYISKEIQQEPRQKTKKQATFERSH